MAGQAAPYRQLGEIKDAVGAFPVIANTGVTFDTVSDILKIADACIVATCIKKDGAAGNRIDPQRVRALVASAGKEQKEQ